MSTAIFIWIVGYMFSLGAKAAHDTGLCGMDFLIAFFAWPALIGFMWRTLLRRQK